MTELYLCKQALRGRLTVGRKWLIRRKEQPEAAGTEDGQGR